MYNVEIKNACSCAMKRGLPDKQTFDDKEEAEKEANKILMQMKNDFCQKHNFELKNEFGNFIIYIRINM